MPHLGRLDSRLIVKLILELERPLHIGLGETVLERHKKLLKIKLINGVEVPIIPSSSIKGALRSISEKIAKNMVFKEKIENDAVQLHIEKAEITHNRSSELFKERVQNIIEKLKRDKTHEIIALTGLSEDKIGEIISNYELKGVEGLIDENYIKYFDLYLAMHCPICRLYGAPRLAGKMKLSDALPLKNIETKFRTHTSIDRKSMTAKEHYLYTLELLEPITNFQLELICDNVMPGESDAKLLAATLNYIKKLGLQLGGRKSIGLGLMKISNQTKCTYINFKELEKPSEAIEAILNPWKHEKPINDIIEILKGTILF